MRCSTLAQKLPAWRVKALANESSVRLHGLVISSDNTVLDVFGGPGRDVAARSLSSYPLEAFPKPNGEIELNPLVRMGDPNCDQFCIERCVVVSYLITWTKLTIITGMKVAQ